MAARFGASHQPTFRPLYAGRVGGALHQLWQAGLGDRMEELWPEVERLHREAGLTLPEAAQQVASVAVRDGLR